MYKCKNCGGELIYSVKDKQLKCESCNSLFSIEDIIDEEENAETMDMTLFTCPSCGGELYSNSNTAASFCSFCGASVTLTQKLVKWKKPKAIIPFTVTREEAKQIVSDKLKGKLFVPSILKNPNNIEMCRGIYIPYWVYDTSTVKVLDGKCEDIKHGSSSDTHNVYSLTGTVSDNKKGLNHDACTTFVDDIGDALNPYKLEEAEPFNSAYFCGFFADLADTKSDEFNSEIEQAAKNVLEKEITDHIKKEHPEFDVVDTNSLNSGDTIINDAILCMFPVWLISYRAKDTVAYFAVNGTTKKVVTDTPVDMKKYYIVASIMSLLSFIVTIIFNQGTAHGFVIGTSILTIIIALFGMYCDKLRRIKESYSKVDIENVTSNIEIVSNNSKNKQKSKVKKATLKFTPFSVLLILLSIGGFLFSWLNIPADLAYYGYIILEIGLSFMYIMKSIQNINLITTRRLPQYDYKGKDVAK